MDNLIKVIELLNEIQTKSEFAVLYSFSGHSGMFRIEIVESEKNYLNTLLIVDAYIDEKLYTFVSLQEALYKVKQFCLDNNLNFGG